MADMTAGVSPLVNSGAGIASAKPKKLHLELIRIVAIVLVIFNHTGFLQFNNVGTIGHCCVMLSSILCKVAVPLFFMVSGALLLGKDEPLEVLFKKRILRFFIVILLFSFLNYIRTVFNDWSLFGIPDFFYKLYTKPIITPYWYLYAYFAILLMLPFLRPMARGMKPQDFKYLGVMSIIFVGVLPTLEYVYGAGNGVNLFLPIITSENILFFIMGYYFENILDKRHFNRKNLLLCVGANVVIIALIWMLVEYKQLMTGGYDEAFIKAFIAIPVFSVFWLMRYLFNVYTPGKAVTWLLSTLGGCVFGVYLLEEFIRNNTHFIYEKLLTISTSVAFVVWIAVVLLVGFVAAFIMKKIPILKKLV